VLREGWQRKSLAEARSQDCSERPDPDRNFVEKTKWDSGTRPKNYPFCNKEIILASTSGLFHFCAMLGICMICSMMAFW